MLLAGEVVSYDLLQPVVIAWNGSLGATRHIGQFMTFLREAERVTGVRRHRPVCAYAFRLSLPRYAFVADVVTKPAQKVVLVGGDDSRRGRAAGSEPALHRSLHPQSRASGPAWRRHKARGGPTPGFR